MKRSAILCGLILLLLLTTGLVFGCRQPDRKLSTVWVSSSSDVFAAGGVDSDGAILHYNGTRWSKVLGSNCAGRFSAIWGSSSSDVFVVGGWRAESLIMHYDGTSWSKMSLLPSKPGYRREFSSVWGSSSSDVFAVGTYGAVGETIGEFLIMHYDGNSWSEMISSTEGILYGVWGSSSSDVFAVGTYGAYRYNGDDYIFEPIILHYDGTSWSEINSGTKGILRDVWGSSSSDVFAVGQGEIYNESSNKHFFGPLIMHYDGNSWSEMNLPPSKQHLWGFLNVWGNSSSDVFVVGSVGTILHYDGTQWSDMNSGTSELLLGVWGSSSSNVFAVGDEYTILHYDGTQWSEMSLDRRARSVSGC